MAAVNATRRGIAAKLNRAVSDARLIGFNDDGNACVWNGGYGFNVYDATQDWNEVDHFNSGQLIACTDYDSDEAYGYAKAAMRSHGFDIIE